MPAFREIDNVIKEAERRIGNLYSRITPSNSREQKEHFLNDDITQPSFTYTDPDYDTDHVDALLDDITVPDGVLGRLYRKKIDEIRLKNRVVANIGDQAIVRSATKQLYGTPDDELVDDAADLLASINQDDGDARTVDAGQVRDEIQSMLDLLGMGDWAVRYYETTAKTSTSVKPSEKTIYLQREREFDANAPARQAVHEAGVHALRSANGHRQNHLIFGIGVPGYMATEEGLATYMEELTGNLDKTTLRKYAGRVLAVDSVLDDDSFRATYDLLHRDHDFHSEMAWNIAKRAHRAGGFIKDHVYFEGRQQIKEYDGDLETLFVGKVALADIGRVETLLEQGVLRPTTYSPGTVLEYYQ